MPKTPDTERRHVTRDRSPVRGFVLHPTYRTERGRPVVLLFGTLEDGRSFLIRDARPVPHFWIRADQEAAARTAGIVPRGSDRRTFEGRPTLRVEATLPRDVPRMRELLERADVDTYEADVRFAYRPLIDRGIRGAIEIEGPSHAGEHVDVVFDEPEIRPAAFSPRLKTLSFDIETDPEARRLLAIALVGCGRSDVLLLTPPGYDCPEGAIACPDEGTLLDRFVACVRAADPDVLTGWNVVDFDLAVLQKIAEREGRRLTLGRDATRVRIQPPSTPGGASRADVAGRLVLDGIQLMRGAFIRRESYALDAVARDVLGRGKTMTGSGRVEEILEAFEHDRGALVTYNRTDAELVLEILDALQLVELAVERSRLTGLPPDRVAASIAAFDFVYLSELGRRRIVAPTVRPARLPSFESGGGHVLEPDSGLYTNVVVLDFKSLYPSLIRTFSIDPLGRVTHRDGQVDPIVAPNGARFDRRDPILPRLLDELMPRREAAKAAGDGVASQAIKILMNSFYGVLGTSACRFAHPELANAITSFGREVLLWCRDRIEHRGLRVVYGDTDSLFVITAQERPDRAERLGRELAREMTDELSLHVRTVWGADSRLELEFERLYLRLMFPELRTGGGGARKRYAGLVQDGDAPRVVFTGMEVVRSDWTALARQVQQELYRRLFSDLPVDDYLRDTVAAVRDGRRDDALVYRKALRKKLDGYTRSSPPHVVAARKMRTRPGRVVEYVITIAGPEPLAERVSALDHEHYVQRQIRPVSEPVLARLGLDFDRVVGDDRQLRLFDP